MLIFVPLNVNQCYSLFRSFELGYSIFVYRLMLNSRRSRLPKIPPGDIVPVDLIVLYILLF